MSSAGGSGGHRISPDTRERLRQALLSVQVRKRKLAASVDVDNVDALTATGAVAKVPKLPLSARALGGECWTLGLMRIVKGT